MVKKFLKTAIAASLSASLILCSPCTRGLVFAEENDIEITDEADWETEESAEAYNEEEYNIEASSEEVSDDEVGTTEEDLYEQPELYTEEIDAVEPYSTGISIDETNFPDENFRAYVKEKIDTDGDGMLSDEEISECTSINVDGYIDYSGNSPKKVSKVSDLTGIEYFVNLQELSCKNNNLSELDISKCTGLETLDCYWNNLSELDVSQCTGLETLSCGYNNLSELDVSQCTGLLELDCSVNNLSELDVNQCTGLETLSCGVNNLSELDVSQCTGLETLDCYWNNLSELDVSQCTGLNYLYCDNNNLSELDVSQCTGLLELDCSVNNLSELDVSQCTGLYYLDCNDNNLSELDVSGCTGLSYLGCDDNNLSELDVSQCTELVEFYCNGNNLSELNVSQCTGLWYFYCNDNNLSQLDVSQCTGLYYLDCNDNNLSELNVSKCTKIYYLDCSGNNLSELDVSQCTRLITLICGTNNLSELNVSRCTRLEMLWCDYNNLSELDVSKCTGLKLLRCDHNKFSELDVSQCTGLETLVCSGNNLSELDVSQCTGLETLVCSGNNLNELDVSMCTGLLELDCGANNLSELNVSECTGLVTLDCIDNNLSELDVSKCTELVTLDCRYNNITSLDTSNNTKLIYLYYESLIMPELSALSNTASGVKVTWSKSDGASGYYVFRRVSGDSWKCVGNVTSGSTLSYIDTTAAAGTVYAYTVRAYYKNSSGNYYYSSYNSSGVGIIRLTQPALNTPTNVSTGIQVSWSKTTGASGYYVFRRVSGDSWKCVGTVTSGSTLSYIDTTAAAGTVYAYTVRAYYKNSSGNYYYSSYNSSGVGIIRLTQPALNTPTNVSTGIQVSWSKTTGASGYYVFRKVSGGSWKCVGTVTSGSTLSFIDKTAAAGTVYAYTVRAYYKNSSGKYYYGSYNTTGKGVIRLKAPTVALSAASGKTTVKWTKTAGAKGYYIYRKAENGSWIRVATITSGSTLSYVDKTTKSGTKYYYAIKAYYGSYISAWSNIPGVEAK